MCTLSHSRDSDWDKMAYASARSCLRDPVLIKGALIHTNKPCGGLINGLKHSITARHDRSMSSINHRRWSSSKLHGPTTKLRYFSPQLQQSICYPPGAYQPTDYAAAICEISSSWWSRWPTLFYSRPPQTNEGLSQVNWEYWWRITSVPSTFRRNEISKVS